MLKVEGFDEEDRRELEYSLAHDGRSELVRTPFRIVSTESGRTTS